MKCPNCGAEAVGVFCEYCGSETPKDKTTINITNNYYLGSEEQQTVTASDTAKTDTERKKKRIWLWALGWICMFPLPLTILLVRKKDMKPAVRVGIIAAAWLLLFLIGIGGTGEPDAPSVDLPPQTEITTDRPEPETSEQENTLNVYVENVVA